VKISATVIEILTFNAWSSKVYHFKQRRPTFHEVDSDVSIDCSPCPWDCRDAELWNFGFHHLYKPPNSPDFNPVEYAICGKLQAHIYYMQIRDVDHLVERLVVEWSRFDQRLSVLQLLSGKLVCMRVWRWTQDIFNTLINDHTVSLEITECYHGNLCFWRVIKNIQ